MTIVNEQLWSNVLIAAGAVECVCRRGAFSALVENDVVGVDSDGAVGHRSKITATLEEVTRYQIEPGDWIDAQGQRYRVQFIAEDKQGVADLYVEPLG